MRIKLKDAADVGHRLLIRYNTSQAPNAKQFADKCYEELAACWNVILRNIAGPS